LPPLAAGFLADVALAAGFLEGGFRACFVAGGLADDVLAVGSGAWGASFAFSALWALVAAAFFVVR
ncbi:MAG: hypothetical protein AAGG79_03905, partial [Pseudomonadota bacterium]